MASLLRTSFLFSLTALLLLYSFAPVIGAEIPQESSREDLQKDFIHYRQNNPSPFGSAPVNHLVPSRNTFTFAISTDRYESVIVPKGMNPKENPDKLTHKHELTGWTVAPLFAISRKNYALGLTIESGERQSHFLLNDEDMGGSRYEEQTSDMTYQGAGGYFYVLVPANALPRAVQVTVMAGITRLVAEHRNNGTRTDKYSETFRTYKYNVNRNQIGVNTALRINRRFSFILWYNYITHKTANKEIIKADAGAEKSDWDQRNDRWDDLLEQDQELFWQAQPRQRLGLDIALMAGKFEIHMGGVLGFIASMGTTPNNIKDNNLFLSFALSTGNR